MTGSQPMWPQQWPGYAGGWHQDAQQYDYSAAWAAWYAQGGGQQVSELDLAPVANLLCQTIQLFI